MSERLSGTVLEKTSVLTSTEVKSSRVEELFASLPVADEVNLDFFSPLVSGENPQELRKKIIDRYLDLYNLRKSQGFEGYLVIDDKTALAILDDEFFEAVVQSIEEDGDLLEISHHETGHGAVAERIGWKAKSETVEPGPGYLGLTVPAPNRPMAFDEWALGFAAIAYGGAINVEMMGYKAKGHGSDLGQVRALARLATANPYSRFSSAESFSSAARNLAHSALSSYPQSDLRRMALDLFSRRTIVK